MKKYRVWYIPQVPWKPYEVLVNTLEEWILVLNTIIWLSIFEFDNNIKPDYSDASWMEHFYIDEQSIEYADKEDIIEIGWVKWVWQEWYNEEWKNIEDLINY